MIGQASTVPQQTAARQDIFHAAANLAGREGYGSLILDHVGRILSCGAPAENMFGAGEGRLVGRRISELVPDMPLDGSSPSYNARYLAFLCASGEWRSFEAKGADGARFTVELKLSRMTSGDEKIFLVNLHLPGRMACH